MKCPSKSCSLEKKRRIIMKFFAMSQFRYCPEGVVQRCSVKKMFIEISQKSQENTCVRVSFLMKMTPAQVFSYEFCEMFKNILFKEHLRATASDYTFIERKTTTFRTKTLRINASEIMFLIKKSRYLSHFLKYRKSNSNGSFLVSYKEDTVI